MTGIDELIDAAQIALAPYDIPTGRWSEADAREPASAVIDAVRALLADRGLLLGPDGLIKAEEAVWDWDGVNFSWCPASGDGTGQLFTLIPQDPTEEP